MSKKFSKRANKIIALISFLIIIIGVPTLYVADEGNVTAGILCFMIFGAAFIIFWMILDKLSGIAFIAVIVSFIFSLFK